MNLAKIEKVDLREIFKNEASDFTTWLSEQDNLDLLGEEIGVVILHRETEASVGNFKVDILCEEAGSEEEGANNLIIIENQLEKTDYKHLGQLITYASGYDAKYIIWIVKEVREEHQKAIEWLNENTFEQVSFFLIKIELWKIENSNPAPKFEVVVKPNKWLKIQRENLNKQSQTSLAQFNFWTQLKSYLENKKIKCYTPQYKNYLNINIGGDKVHITLRLNSFDNFIGCELYFENNKDLYKTFYENKNVIEKDITDTLEWKDNKVSSIISVKKEVKNIFDENLFEENFKWIYDKFNLLKKIYEDYSNH